MFTFTVNFIMVVYALSLLIAFVRLVLGPTLPDRVVAVDFISTCLIGFIALHAIRTGDPHYLGAAIVLALLAFVGTTAFTYYLKKVILP
jgi:multicomponent Na+:H+ antiporter subunit F